MTAVHEPALLDPFRALSRHPEPERPLAVPSLMTVTPGMAAGWLERNTSNRQLREPYVAQLARDMRSGNWDVNGETIKVAADGTLLDGQHRLHACVKAQVPFETFVVTGLPLTVQRTMDIGAKRKVSDHLTLAGEKNTRALAAVARWALMWLRGARGKAGRETEPTHPEILAFIESEPRLREAADFAVRAHSQFPGLRVSVYGMAYMLMTGVNDIAAQVFLGRVSDGADISAGHPAHTLRARIVRAKGTGERLTEWEQLALMVLAWNAFRDDRKAAILKLPTGGLSARNFPEPR